MKFIDGYYAKNQDGAAYWYEKMPEKRDTAWAASGSFSRATRIQIDGP